MDDGFLFILTLLVIGYAALGIPTILALIVLGLF